jgi:hypothetical protein
MDHFTRRIIGFGVQPGDIDGIALCRMFNAAISTQGVYTNSALTTTRYSNFTDCRPTYEFLG